MNIVAKNKIERILADSFVDRSTLLGGRGFHCKAMLIEVAKSWLIISNLDYSWDGQSYSGVCLAAIPLGGDVTAQGIGGNMRRVGGFNSLNSPEYVDVSAYFSQQSSTDLVITGRLNAANFDAPLLEFQSSDTSYQVLYSSGLIQILRSS
jgi:hypothetical protein